jgi:hypothetical protein
MHAFDRGHFCTFCAKYIDTDGPATRRERQEQAHLRKEGVTEFRRVLPFIAAAPIAVIGLFLMWVFIDSAREDIYGRDFRRQ